MKKIRKYQTSGKISYPGFSTLDFNLLTPDLGLNKPWMSKLNYPQLPNFYTPGSFLWKLQNMKTMNETKNLWELTKKNVLQLWGNPSLLNNKLSFTNQIAGVAVNAATSALGDKASELLGNSELGRSIGTLFSSGLDSAGNTITNNIIKGENFALGLGQNAASSVAGAASGLAANYIGKGITSALGDSKLARGIGQGVSTGLGTIGGQITSNLVNNGKVGLIFGKAAGSINPYALAGQVLGSALGAGLGPSSEYSGKYGGITQGMDLAYDGIMAGVNAIPVWGQGISALMALNKGAMNLFGSTSGMTTLDAILGSAFMPAPVKWVNMIGAKTTDTFKNLSWQNSEKANSFMGNSFGNLNDRFDQAREEAGKTYGLFSRGAYEDALNNMDFANRAWQQILAMADLNEIQKIRSQYMSSINNQRYALLIQGGFKPLMRGKLGMKIFNNATNHNIGMRLLSGAALIDNKQMILSAQGGTKVTRPPRMRAHRKGDESKGLTPEEQEWWKLHEEEQKRLLEEETTKKIKEKEEDADKFNQQVNTVMGAMTQQANETPFTGLEYQQAAENLRQKKVEKFHEAEKIAEATMMADLAVGAAPLLLRGFRWAFNKAGLLVKVPVLKTIQLKSGITKSVLDNGKIRLSLPSHTDNKPRQFVLEPARDAGNNKHYVHMRMWDDVENKIPASNVTNEEKQQLFDALYNELPEGAEILFPKSGPGNYGTRGTIAGLQRLSRDPRFTPGTKGILQYLDKDGKTVRTYEGTSFIKTGLLDKIPNKNSLKGFNFNDLPQEKYIYNNRTGNFDVIAPKKEWIQKGENELVPDYFTSPLEKERLIATGISSEEALDIMDVRWINSIEALPGKLRNLGKNTFGDAQNINGRAFVRYNSRKGVNASLNDASTTLNTVFHELGGHGSSLNIGYGTQTIPINMKDILMKIYKHNESLRPLLKPFYQAIKDGNFDLAKNLAKNEGIELSSLKGSSGDIDFKSLKDFIQYMEENLEYSARAIGSNMSNHYGMPNGWNEKQLRDIFTKESVDNLLKNVWNYGVPITVGGTTAATLHNKSK